MIRKFDDKFEMSIKWLTRKVKVLFRVKDKSLHQSCKIYKGVCSCRERYISETVRNVEVRWNEYKNARKKSKFIETH